ncbi:Nucleic acid-binding, OB-fold [Sesbania bispinosa]|nr:Nucleic acid-binding, OB-fold [Sesbania bispinosa]
MALVSCGYHYVNSICGIRNSWRLKVRLIRIWNMCAVATPGDPFATQMVFVDEEGGRIEATVQKHNMKRFANVMVEGQVYKITNFGVMRNDGNFRACGHEFKLSFNANTKITFVPTAAIPYTGLALIKCSDIRKINGHSTYLFDFMGIVTGVSEEINLNKIGRATRLMLLDMVDEMGNIRCAIFGQLVEAILGFLASTETGLPVDIIQVGRVNLYKDIPLAVEFKNSLAVHEIETDVAISRISDRARPVSTREGFLQLYPRKKVGQLHEMFEEGFFIIMATIKEIIEEDLWWYKIKVLVFAGDDNAHLDHIPRPVFKRLQRMKWDPSDILNFVGKELLFRIERKEDPTFGYDDCFKVRRICSDSSIISEFKEDIADETPLKVEVSPISFAPTSATEGECSVLSKRLAESPSKCVADKRKRGKNKPFKIERI